ncbi:hypothetical protein C0Q70_07975 [Pomacea canaliculata]|uniref:DM1 domain-containing protein n=2 Tax=Pomacea canaliculata TaxID=400727 RepID=A0A2T7PGH6_POMCA|nr:hypothetical protein C0Q70_07975 [Pomacea canaliculata]
MKESQPARKVLQEACYYAFVKFYSHFAAKKAKAFLSKNLKLGSQICKVEFANRTKETEMQQVLPAVKCQELANYYLGFNGWSSSIKRLEEDQQVHEDSSRTRCKRFFCIIELTFPKQGLSTQGLGAWEEMYTLQDSCSKALAIHKARKCCKLRAIEHAFSKVLLIVLHNGKVTVEINTSKPDMLTDMQVEKMADEQVLRVTELDDELESEDNEDAGNQENNILLDDVNLHILQELEN